MFDADARRIAVDPTQNVVLEASAGTGKTRVLVERYVNLLLAGVEPDRILAVYTVIDPRAGRDCYHCSPFRRLTQMRT